MLIKNTYQEFDFNGCDRILALLIGANGEIYEGSNHQECFYDYCRDLEELSNWNLNWEDEDDVSKITHSLFMNENEPFYGFDIWLLNGKKYLVPHFRHNLEKCLNIIINYNKNRNYILGIYKDFLSLQGYVIAIK